jgi:hypothetical protein
VGNYAWVVAVGAVVLIGAVAREAIMTGLSSLIR